ncbi:MAG: hypothetical protein QOJ75_2460 [Chloroflexota bacterium]|jgi:hypothetical protein|nr:hypothetical protein [Chloroflexota bacterium]
MKQDGMERRLNGVQAPFQQIVVSVIRAAILVALALLLILGLLPAALAAEAGSI